MATWPEPYVTDGDGREWHVYDVARVSGRIRRLEPGGPEATRRIFVAEDRRQAAQAVGAGEPRERTAELLERQLRLALSAAAWSNLELSDWRVVQEALARRVPHLVRAWVRPDELTEDEYESLLDVVDAELDRRRRGA